MLETKVVSPSLFVQLAPLVSITADEQSSVLQAVPVVFVQSALSPPPSALGRSVVVVSANKIPGAKNKKTANKKAVTKFSPFLCCEVIMVSYLHNIISTC
ncbi:MAG: hypothetical protein Q8R26_00810 [bacterium]|nr:hypothetical protein [bacterium]